MGIVARYVLFLIATGLAASPSHAQTGADFYKDKTVTYIVATAPGGGYDLYGRLIAEYMQKYLPGSTFVVKNVPGAGHIVGANTLYASKPDGLTIGTFNTGLIFTQLVGNGRREIRPQQDVVDRKGGVRSACLRSEGGIADSDHQGTAGLQGHCLISRAEDWAAQLMSRR